MKRNLSNFSSFYCESRFVVSEDIELFRADVKQVMSQYLEDLFPGTKIEVTDNDRDVFNWKHEVNKTLDDFPFDPLHLGVPIAIDFTPHEYTSHGYTSNVNRVANLILKGSSDLITNVPVPPPMSHIITKPHKLGSISMPPVENYDSTRTQEAIGEAIIPALDKVFHDPKEWGTVVGLVNGKGIETGGALNRYAALGFLYAKLHQSLGGPGGSRVQTYLGKVTPEILDKFRSLTTEQVMKYVNPVKNFLPQEIRVALIDPSNDERLEL